MTSLPKAVPFAVVLGLTITAGVYFYAGTRHVTPNGNPAIGASTNAKDAQLQQVHQPTPTESSFSPKVQQLIDSGALSLPPGNPSAAHSVVIPFTGAAIADADTIQSGKKTSRHGASSQQDEAMGTAHQIGTMVPSVASQSTVSTAQAQTVASISPTPNISESSQNTLTQPNSSTVNQPIVFETPPGIGSTKGGN